MTESDGRKDLKMKMVSGNGASAPVNQDRASPHRANGVAPAAIPLIDILHRANQIVNQRFASAIGETGPTPRQLSVLASIAASDGLSQTEISDATGIDRATTAEVVGRLTRLGLVKRRRTRHDARTYAVSLTDKGQEVFSISKGISAKIEADLLELLPEDDRATLTTLLGRLVTAANQPA